ncbi:putative Cutinase transcription factor 1 alpha [Glarea lozoyensis 74030]|uniref:Putative Cutinase transcription factor 1 alpha n=1 Tax=Glarea lozoyensis (strain ATCC 74030 / MF5533) TaxID=1104152 RepID=H0EI98_GLAL7|nr:putative Cutinase transcription factor 1 alpha [Glarea lozoyensis 74030]
MHVYQMRSSIPSVVQATQERLRICMNALKDVSKVWLVAKMVYTLFESILGNKVLEERLQKAAGKRHKKMAQTLSQGIQQAQMKREEPQKRKYDDMALDFGVTPAPQESYERSRPQTPSQTPSRELGQNAGPMAPPISSPNARANNDTFMGGSNSRPHTRPPTPFNPSYSVPATPPDLYLVTRNSPNLSHPPQNAYLQPGNTGYPQQMPPNMWQGGMDQAIQDAHSPSDTLSNASAQAVPMTMNVEDWFQFFGINGDLSGMNGDAPLV